MGCQAIFAYGIPLYANTKKLMLCCYIHPISEAMNRRQKIFLGVISVAVASLIIAGTIITTYQKSSENLQVVVTFYPLYFFASEIGKERVEVSMLIPDNAEVHSWQPAISDMLKVEKAKIFVYNGAGLEPWVEDFLGAVKNKPVIVDTSQNIPIQLSPHLQEVLESATNLLAQNCTQISFPQSMPIQPSNTTAYSLHLNQNIVTLQLNISHESKILLAFNKTFSFELRNTTVLSPALSLNYTLLASYSLSFVHIFHLDPGIYEMVFNASNQNEIYFTVFPFEVTEGEEEEEHGHGIYDPHIWLDPLLAKIQVRNILEGFKAADPENAHFYQTNAETLLKKLDKLHSDFTNGLKNRTKNAIICSHLAFNYMGKRYGFNVHAAIGITADREPSPTELAKLVDLINTLQLHYVFVEPGYSDRYMQTLANQTGAGILVLDAVHGRTGEHANLDYFQIMYENLKNLRTGLEVVD